MSNQFVDEFLREKDTRKAKRAEVWQGAMLQQRYLALSPTPENLPEIYESSEQPPAHALERKPGQAFSINPITGKTTMAPSFDADYGKAMEAATSPEASEGVRQIIEKNRSDFVRKIEEAVYRHGDQIPLAFWLQFTPEEVELYGGEEMKELASELETLQQWQAEDADFRASVKAEVDRRMEGVDRRRNMQLGGQAIMEDVVHWASLGLLKGSAEEGSDTRAVWDKWMGERDEVTKAVEYEFLGKKDELFEGDIAEWREKQTEYLDNKYDYDLHISTITGVQMPERSSFIQETLESQEQEIRASIQQGLDPSRVLGTGRVGNFVMDQAGQAMWALGDILGKTAAGSMRAIDLMPNMGIMSPYEVLIHDAEEQRDAQIAAVDSTLGLEDAELSRKLSYTSYRAGFDEMQTENPDAYNELLRVAGMDPTVAFSIFASQASEAPEAQEQMSNYITELREGDQELINKLQEQNFSASGQVLNILGAYGRAVPGRLSAGFAALITDTDHWDEVTHLQFGKLFTELEASAKKSNYTPSGVLGIEGSLAGLMLDLGGGIMFDPMTWFFGARGSVRSARAGSAATANGIAKAPITKAFVNEYIHSLYSPSQGATATTHLGGWMPDWARAEIMELVGVGPRALPARTWLQAKHGQQSAEISVGFLREIAGDAAQMTPKALESLQKSIKEVGFLEPVEIAISRADGTVTLNNGAKRLLAAEGMEGVSHIPAYVRVVDDLPTGFQSLVAKIPEGIRTKVIGKAENWDGVVGQAVLEWTKKPNSRRVFDDILNGKTPKPEHLETLTEAQQIAFWKDRTQATAILRELKMLDDPALGPLNPGGQGAGKYQGNLWRGHTFEGTAPQIGEVFEIRAGGSSTERSTAQGFVGKKKSTYDHPTGPSAPPPTKDTRLLTFEEGTPGRMVEGIVKGESEVLVSGKFEVVDIDVVTGEMQVRRVGSALDSLSTEGVAPGMNLHDINPDLSLSRVGSKIDDTVHPSAIMSPEQMIGSAVPREAIERIVARAIESGAVPDGAHRTAMASHLSAQIREAVASGKGTQWIHRYLTKQNTVTRYELAGARAVERITDSVIRMFGDDIVSSDHWLNRVFEYQIQAQRKARIASERLQALTPLREEIAALTDMTGGAWDDTLRHQQQVQGGTAFDDVAAKSGSADADLGQALANRKQLQEVLNAKTAEFNNRWTPLEKELMDLGDTRQLADIMDEVWDDYYTKYIETNPEWAHVERLPNGKPDWTEFHKGRLKKSTGVDAEGVRQMLPKKDLAAMAAETGQDVEQLAQRLSQTHDTQLAWEAPLSPLEMIMARETGGAKWIKFTHAKTVSSIREFGFQFQMAWVLDKVFRGATAVTVSFDEVLRLWHIGGNEAVLRYFGDKAIYMQARGKAALTHPVQSKLGMGSGVVDRTIGSMSPKAQARFQALQDFPTYLKQAERQMYDGNGLGWTDVLPDDPHYFDAANRWAGGMLQDSGFRAMLRGKDAFDEWFFSVDGTKLRQSIAMDPSKTGKLGTRVLQSSEEAYNGWVTLFEKVILREAKRAGKYDEVYQAFVATAKRVDDSGGHAVNLPSSAVQHLGPVRGVQKVLPNKAPVSLMTEAFFDRFFMDPVNYRRGFLADMIRRNERTRLTSLFQSQGKRIVKDIELERMLGLNGLGGGTRVGVKNVLQEQALRMGLVPESYIDDIIERAVETEISNVLYTWDKGTRAGSQAKFVFPFGRPWADMAGFWGRETLRKPVLRGLVNEKNFLGLRTMNDKGWIPVNPRTPAMMSRLAHTDFTVDKGFAGEKEGGLFPGSEKTDFSPLFFLPTGGDNPFGMLLPGLGFVPMWALDQVFEAVAPDPVKDPLGYQETLEEWSDFVPMLRYQQGGFASRLLGGGTAATVLGGIADVGGARGKDPYFGLTTTIGDVTREVNATRELSVLLANPENLEMLSEAQTEEQVRMLVESFSTEADQKASTNHGLEAATRWVVPANSQFDLAIGEIQDVWVEAAASFPELQVRPDLAGGDMNDPQVRADFANDVRGAFFDLPQWKRDLFVSQQPNLAVNLISTWEWNTDRAVAANLPGIDLSYRTGGSAEDRALHQYYVENQYIKPLNTYERALRIVGLMNASKDRAAKLVYTKTAESVNDLIWEAIVDPEVKGFLEAFATGPFAAKWGVTDARDLWNSWGTVEEELERALATELGIEEEGEAWDNLRASISIPSKQKPWGKTWPGLDEDELSGRFGDFPLMAFEPEVMELAEGLGIELTPGMTGEQLYRGVQGTLTEETSPLNSVAKFAYDAYVNERSSGSTTAEAELNKLRNNPDLSPGFKQGMTEFLYRTDKLVERYRGQIGGMPLSEQQAVVDNFMQLRNAASENIAAWDTIWDAKYGRTFGDLDWVPPTPLSPFDDAGEKRPEAIAPFIRHLQDGDSFYYSDKPGDGETMHGVRLLGVKARDFGSDDAGAMEDMNRLQDALNTAIANGDTIWLVRDPNQVGSNTDMYGRMLAWLWIGDKPYYFEDDFQRQLTTSGRSDS